MYNGLRSVVEAPIIKCVSRVQIEVKAAAKKSKNSWPLSRKFTTKNIGKIRISHSKRLCKWLLN